MKINTWKPGLTPEQERDIAYWERNMLALCLCDGWYYDTDNNWEGWKRVISCAKGKLTFHIPDDFDVGDVEEIEPNWDGHTTELKWERVMCLFGIKVDKEEDGCITSNVSDSQEESREDQSEQGAIDPGNDSSTTKEEA